MGGRTHVRFRHRVVYFFLRPFFRIYLRIMYGYRFEKASAVQYPALIYANHNCNFDPFFVAMSFKAPVYFIASDHIFRLGWVSRLIRFWVAPIPIAKSQLDLQAIKDMMRVRDEGGTICLFPEGNRSFNGRTTYIAPAAAKLAKLLNIPLVLYRIEGGYLSTPRWGKGIRRGRVTGAVHTVVSLEEITAMSSDVLLKIIREALFVDAFALQRARPTAHKAKSRTLYLQRVLYTCPQCHGFSTMESEGNDFTCRACGFAVYYNEYGFFEAGGNGQTLPYEDIWAWDQWQKDYLRNLIRRPDFMEEYVGTPLFSDRNCEMYRAERAQSSELVARGSLQLYCDRLEFQGEETKVFAFTDIVGMNPYMSQIMQLSASGELYDIRNKKPMSVTKYVNAFYFIKYRMGGEPDGFISI